MQEKPKAETVFIEQEGKITLPDYKAHQRGKGMIRKKSESWHQIKCETGTKKMEQNFEIKKDYHEGKLDRVE